MEKKIYEKPIKCNYIATILIRIGEYETYTSYVFTASDKEEAMKHVIEGYDIGSDDFERVSELYDLTEVSEAEYEVLRKYI